jgi:uncharacterized glyoxalase superfamily protein PhnB
MAGQVKPIPEGHHSVTPYLIVKGAPEAIDFYVKAFGATEIGRMPGPDGRLIHAEISIGNSRVMLADEFCEFGARSAATIGGSPVTIHLYVEDVDAVFNRAVAAGATAKMAPADMFWGDRYGKLTDPFGHEWSLATHTEDLTPDQMRERGKAAMAAGSP